MKKLITKTAMVIALAAVAAYGVYASQKQEVTLSETALANVEALARGESAGYTGCRSGSGYCAIYWGETCIFSSYSHYPY